MEKLRHQGKEWARVKQQKTQLTRQPQRSAPVLGATGEARAEVGRSPSLGRKPHGPPHPALLLPSPLRIGMATETLESPTQPLLCGQDGGDLIMQLSSQTETVSWAQPWRPQPWGHCLSLQETLTCVLQIQYIQQEIPPDRSHPPREQHQGLRTESRHTPVPRRHWLCVAVWLLRGCGRGGVSDARGEQCPSAPPRLLCLMSLNLFLSNICENVLGTFKTGNCSRNADESGEN